MVAHVVALLTSDYAVDVYALCEIGIVGYAVVRFLKWDAQHNESGE